MSERCAQALTLAYHSYTHPLFGVVQEEVAGPGGPPVKVQENTALLRCFCLTGTSQHVSLSGVGGKECSISVHSLDDDEVGLCPPLLAEARFVARAAPWCQREMKR